MVKKLLRVILSFVFSYLVLQTLSAMYPPSPLRLRVRGYERTIITSTGEGVNHHTETERK